MRPANFYTWPMANLGYSFLLVLTAFLWGTTFVAQVEGNSAGPFVFTCLRSFIATGFLFGLVKVLDRLGFSSKRPKSKKEKKTLWIAGILCGTALAFGNNLQQLGIALGTSAGKAGFLTACYLFIVPILGIFLGKKCSVKIWICVAIALVGLYLLCIKENFSFELCDSVTLLCAIAFAVQILVVDKFVGIVDNVRLSCIQFLVVGILSAFPMFFADMGASLQGIKSALEVYSHTEAWFPLLYAGILSSGVAFTLQIIAQNKIRPTVASLLMSLESVFAVLAGCIVLGERLSAKEAVGCILIFAAIVLAQIRFERKSRNSVSGS